MAVSFAVRVHPDFQGRGVMTRMNKWKESYLRQHLNHDIYIRMSQVYNPKLHLPNRQSVDSQYDVMNVFVSHTDTLSNVRKAHYNTPRNICHAKVAAF